MQTDATKDVVTFTVGDQAFGVPVGAVQDVLGRQELTLIPLAGHAIAGALNLRGRIVTAIDLRRCLGLPESEAASMSVVVDHEGELYSLLVDGVGEVLALDQQSFERHPPTLNADWREITAGIYRLEKGLLVLLDVSRLLELGCNKAVSAAA